MRRFALAVFSTALVCAQTRYARVGELEGTVEAQLQAADPWKAALRNAPVTQLSWLRTGPASRLELELDEGSLFRLGPDSLCELSDYLRLSTGQRVTLLSLDRGVAYFTGQPESKDAMILALPGAQITVRRGSRLRLEANPEWSQVAVIEGEARFSSLSAELDLKEGQMARVNPASRDRFLLYREVSPLDSDTWNEERDKLFSPGNSAHHVPGPRHGLRDLDTKGTWIDTAQHGPVWKPSVADDWTPFRNGKWAWYDTLGFTWISGETWGWLPYHYGRWMHQDQTGWFWVPGKGMVFKPGEAYWLRGQNLIGWGPLAPGENWSGSSVPQQYMSAHTTFAKFAPEAREIVPAEVAAKPKDPLAGTVFTIAPPSPSFVAARLEAARPVLRAGSTRIVPTLSGFAYEAPPVVATQRAPEPERVEPPRQQAVVAEAPREELPVYVAVPVPNQPIEVYYPAPVYTGIIVVNPPEKHDRRDRRPPAPVQPAKPPEPRVPAKPEAPRQEVRIPRTEQPPAKEETPVRTDTKVPRQDSDTTRSGNRGRGTQ